MKYKLGAHVSFLKATQLKGSIEQMIELNSNSAAFYISDSRGYIKSFPIDSEMTKQGHILAKENEIELKDIIVHSPLIGNIANTDTTKNIYERTLESYTKDIKRMDLLGLTIYNFHPGSSPDRELGFKKVADAINKIHSRSQESNTILCLETMMKKGNFLGKNFQELATIISMVENKDRVGVTFDTCHVWDAGYDLSDIDSVLEEFDKLIGLKYLKGMHINDSKNELGSGKDRHAAIGEGFIGLDNLKKIVNHPKLKNLPKALETPYKEDNISKWSKEIKLLLD